MRVPFLAKRYDNAMAPVVEQYVSWSSKLDLINFNLVGGLEHFLFSHILGIIIPID